MQQQDQKPTVSSSATSPSSSSSGRAFKDKAAPLNEKHKKASKPDQRHGGKGGGAIKKGSVSPKAGHVSSTSSSDGQPYAEVRSSTHSQPHAHHRDPDTWAMEAYLAEAECYESERGLHERREALKALNVLAMQWMQSLVLCRGSLKTRSIERIGGRIVTYGSYMLGISHKGADIDALCLAPKGVTREEYFRSFYQLLSYQKEVTELRSIEEAYVPVIKMRYRGIEIDMTFARLDMDVVPLEDELLKHIPPTGLDAKCLRSLNGFRATQEILRLVPNLATFRVALRAIKLWAKNQGLYSNTLGFLGGFSWATLVAKTCMLYPQLTPAQTVQRFFTMFSEWEWPNYVSLVDLKESESENSIDPSVVVQQQQNLFNSWNPDKYLDKMQAMPIITPTYPHMNSTFNVASNTLRLIQSKMREAAAIVDEIMSRTIPWHHLFAMRHILDEANEFLLLMASAKVDASLQWFGLIESKIRHFICGLELSVENRLSCARIWPKPWRNHGKGDIINLVWFVGIEHGHDVNLSEIETMPYTCNFLSSMTTHAAKFKTPDMSFKVHSISKAELYDRLTPQELNTLVSCQSYSTDGPPSVPGTAGPQGGFVYPPLALPAGTAANSRAPSPSSNQNNVSSAPRGGDGRAGGKRSSSQGAALSPPLKQPPVMPAVSHNRMGGGLQQVFTAGPMAVYRPGAPSETMFPFPPHPNHHPPYHQKPFFPFPHHPHSHGVTAAGESGGVNRIPPNNGSFYGPDYPHYSYSQPPSYHGNVFNSTTYAPVPVAAHKRGPGQQSKNALLSSASDGSSTDTTLDVESATASSPTISLGASSSHDPLPRTSSSESAALGRSISISSDKFPPPALVKARVTHSEKLPHSPNLSTPPPSHVRPPPPVVVVGNRFHTDVSVPPPPTPQAGSPSRAKTAMTIASTRSQRVSSTSELVDVNTPLPIDRPHFPPLNIHLHSNNVGSAFAADQPKTTAAAK